MRRRVVFGAEAAADLEALGHTPEMRIRRASGQLARWGQGPGLYRVRTPTDVAACEILEDDRTLVVYAVVRRRDVMRMLVGDEIDKRVRARRMSALSHGRWWRPD